MLLPRCLLLALLVHIWLALMIGIQPGTAEPGMRGFGSLSVTLRGPSGTAADGAAAPVFRDDGPLGQAPSSRHGGRVRQQPAPPDSGPGAQQQGRWKAEELPPDASRAEDDAEGSRGDGALDLPAPTPRIEAPPSPAVPAAPEPVRRTLPSETQTVARSPQLEALSAPQAVAELRPAPTLPEAQLPEAVVRNLPRDAAASLRRPQLSTIESPSLPSQRAAAELQSAPTLPEIPTPVVRSLPRETAPSRATQLRAIEASRPSREAAADLQPAPTLPEIVMPETVLRALPREAGGTRRATQLKTIDAPGAAQPTASALRPAPTLPELPPEPRLLAAPRPAPRQQAGLDSLQAPQQSSTVAAEALSPLPPAAAVSNADLMSNPAPLTRGDPLANPQPGPRASAGSPDAGAQVGHDVATPPSASASAPLRPLNLNLPRTGPSASRRGPGLLELLPAPPERKSKLEQAVDEASREDCRKAHSDKGLLGALPLAVDSARGKGCKW